MRRRARVKKNLSRVRLWGIAQEGVTTGLFQLVFQRSILTSQSHLSYIGTSLCCRYEIRRECLPVVVVFHVMNGAHPLFRPVRFQIGRALRRARPLRIVRRA